MEAGNQSRDNSGPHKHVALVAQLNMGSLPTGLPVPLCIIPTCHSTPVPAGAWATCFGSRRVDPGSSADIASQTEKREARVEGRIGATVGRPASRVSGRSAPAQAETTHVLLNVRKFKYRRVLQLVPPNKVHLVATSSRRRRKRVRRPSAWCKL